MVGSTLPAGQASREKALIRALHGHRVDPPPIWLMRQAGRYLPEYRALRTDVPDFLTRCYTPELAAEITLQPIRRFALDAAIVFSDILVVPDALGRRVRFVEGEGPRLDPITTPEEITALDPTRVMAALAPVYEAVARTRAGLPDPVALIGFAGAPWTVAAYMIEGGSSREYAVARCFARHERAAFARLIDVLIEATAAHLIAQVDAGADAVQLFDSWAGVLPEPEFVAWCEQPARRIVEAVRAARPEVPVIAFPRGAGALYERYARAVRPQALGLDTAVPLDWAAAVLPSELTLQGNLDPIALVEGGPGLRVEVERIVGALGRRAHVFNLGHGILPETDPAHVEALIATLRNARTSHP